MKHILITGGAGFIGSHTADILLEQGMDVVVYDNLSTGKRANLDWSHPRLRLIQADILDYAKLKKEIENVDAVLHLAALPSVPHSIENPILSLQINTQGFLHVLQAIRETKKNIRLVYASSAAVYGDTKELPCCDEEALSACVLSPYALEKANSERYAALFFQLFGIKSLGLRYFNVYGERQDPSSIYSGVISKFLNNYKENKPISILGDGHQSRDFIAVKDVAKANSLALLSEYNGVLNIATGIPQTLLNLIHYLELAGKHKAEIEFQRARVGDICHSYAKVNKAKKFLSFEHEISLEEGIRNML